MEKRILGSLLASAVGDAMGAATELRTKEMIRQRFGGTVRDIVTPPDDTFARGSAAGSVTDDFSLIYHTATAIADNGGIIDDQAVNRALLSWSEDHKFYDQYVGPTTRAAVDKIRGVERENPYAFICCDNAKASNGSAMKISPAGLFNPGNVDKAIIDAITICRPTHNNNLSISGACAIAAAVSHAMEANADVYSIVQAGLYGAEKGLELSEGSCNILAGPSVSKRIKLAVDIAMTAGDMDAVTTELADVVGSGLHISEAVPCVFGILVAAKGNTMDAIIGAVNIGSDTDTIASMTGAVLGARNGTAGIPEHYLQLIDQVNGFDIAALAHRMADLVRY
ncbi:ADP-ribosylglycohydrolase family protein [Angelakisella massiliensis]|uniref:ADP-ribosylglycohydrolase family protein n=1 Tax=Angelakisella massiliensis TaxID=1871018 RepID=UPI000A8C9AF1|nr:ADP-ribosylglycohydrolase family protein [Angelakisella massiliensis]